METEPWLKISSERLGKPRFELVPPALQQNKGMDYHLSGIFK